MNFPPAGWRAVLALAGAALLFGGLLRLRVDNSPEAWLDPAAPATLAWKESQARFGPDEFLAFASAEVDPFSPEGWRRQRGLAEALRKDERFDGVADLPSIAERLGLGADPPEGEARERLASSPMLSGRLIGQGGRGAAVFARTHGGDSPARRKLLADARALARERGGWTVAGPVAFNAELDLLTERDSALIVSAMALVAFAGAWLALRSFAGACAALSGALCGILAWLGALGWGGFPVSAAAAAGLPLLAVAGAENAIHVWLGAREGSCSFRESARRLGGPLLAANATTALALTALAFSPLRSIRLMGLTLPVGVAASFFWARRGLPALLDARGVRPPLPAGGKRFGRFCAGLALAGARRRRLAASLAGMLILAGVAAGLSLGNETNIALQLSPGTRLAQDLEAAGAVLGGTLPLALEISPDGGGADPLAAVREARALAEKLRSDPRVASVAGPADFLALALGEAWDEAPGSRFLALGALAASDPAESLFHASTGTARLEVLLPQLPSDELGAFLDGLGADFEPKPGRPLATGAAALMLKAQRDLLRSQLLGLGASLALVGACLLVFFRSVRLALAAVPPNLLPIAAAALALAAAGWPLDFASAQLAAMIFGLAVNGTIFLAASAKRLDRPTPGRLGVLFGRLGPAVAVSAGLAAAAFACAGFSDLLSLRRLGLAAALASASAAAADLILLPALLARRKGGKKFRSEGHYLQPETPRERAQS